VTSNSSLEGGKTLTGARRRPGRLEALEPVGHLLQDGLQLQHVAGLREAAGRDDLDARQTKTVK
jgi:hypothetical protein